MMDLEDAGVIDGQLLALLVPDGKFFVVSSTCLVDLLVYLECHPLLLLLMTMFNACNLNEIMINSLHLWRITWPHEVRSNR